MNDKRETRNGHDPTLQIPPYLVAIHLLFAGVAIYLLLPHRIWLPAVEFPRRSWAHGRIEAYRSLFGTIELIQTGARSCGPRLHLDSRSGHPEMDQLIEITIGWPTTCVKSAPRLQEQNCFLDKITASPSGTTLDFDQRIAINPAAERLLQFPKRLLGRRLQIRVAFCLRTRGPATR